MTKMPFAVVAALVPPWNPRPDPGPDVESLCAQLLHGGRAGREGAASVLGRRGTKGAIDCLVFAAANDQDPAVRRAAVASFGVIGAPARIACPHLKPMVAISVINVPITAAEEESWLRYEDLRRTARAAMAKIGCP